MDRNVKLMLGISALILVMLVVWGIGDVLKVSTDKKGSELESGEASPNITDSGLQKSLTDYGSAANAPQGTKAKAEIQKRKHSYYFPKRRKAEDRAVRSDPEADQSQEKETDRYVGMTPDTQEFDAQPDMHEGPSMGIEDTETDPRADTHEEPGLHTHEEEHSQGALHTDEEPQI